LLVPVLGPEVGPLEPGLVVVDSVVLVVVGVGVGDLLAGLELDDLAGRDDGIRRGSPNPVRRCSDSGM
jgi:hypothetical protein